MLWKTYLSSCPSNDRTVLLSILIFRVAVENISPASLQSEGVGLVGGWCGHSIATTQRSRWVRKGRVVAEWEAGLPVCHYCLTIYVDLYPRSQIHRQGLRPLRGHRMWIRGRSRIWVIVWNDRNASYTGYIVMLQLEEQGSLSINRSAVVLGPTWKLENDRPNSDDVNHKAYWARYCHKY